MFRKYCFFVIQIIILNTDMKTSKEKRIIKQKYVHPLSKINSKRSNFNEKKTQMINSNSENISLANRETEVFHSVIIQKSSFFKKFCIILKNIYIYHLLSLSMVLLAICIQIFYPYSCYLDPICVCNDQQLDSLRVHHRLLLCHVCV